MLGIINSPFVSTTLLVPARVLAAALGAVMAYGAIAPKSADADLISIQNVSGQPAVVSGSEMFAKNQPEGLLYHDSGDQRWSTYLQQENPPGMGVNEDWLRIYSKQFSQYVGDGWEYRVDNRPFSGSDANQPFPLVGDIQGGAIAGSSLDGSYIRFEMQEGPDIDQGRQYYSWTMNLLQGVTFQDGTTTKSGVWDTASGSIHNLPALVGPSGDIDGQYFTIDVTPAIPEPSTTGLILTGLTAAAAYRRRSRRSRVSGA
ncbi:MAG: PEP-CTERM sorting domain-containing protein [Candidatus Marinimicrobia bacterium]|nr:PEP-CTERM sorting domain-containing protein [Candidatus Neomarinimicrobiota bacterium]